MPITKLNIEDFLQLGISSLLLDVRSPGEFAHAHIPQAISIPLFTDEERKVVGTAYKQESKQKAVKHGLKYFGSNIVAMVEAVEELMAKRKNDSSNTVLVHCWRGGMRSAGVAWLLDLYGFEVYTLGGGYKAYRNWVLKQFEQEYNLMVVGGLTGCGKTPVLHQLTKMKEKMIDLEGLANHRGSAFGGLDAVAQPSQEMFENLLAASLQQAAIEHKIIWVENESQRIGNLNIPGNFFKKMRTGPVLFLNIPFEERLKHIVDGYGKHKKEELINTIVRIKKRLGGLETKNAINFLLEDNVEACFSILLHYYDKLYMKSTNDREAPEQLITNIDANKIDALANAKKLIDYARR